MQRRAWIRHGIVQVTGDDGHLNREAELACTEEMLREGEGDSRIAPTGRPVAEGGRRRLARRARTAGARRGPRAPACREPEA